MLHYMSTRVIQAGSPPVGDCHRHHIVCGGDVCILQLVLVLVAVLFRLACAPRHHVSTCLHAGLARHTVVGTEPAALRR